MLFKWEFELCRLQSLPKLNGIFIIIPKILSNIQPFKTYSLMVDCNLLKKKKIY